MVTTSHLQSVDWEVGVVLEGRALAVPLSPFCHLSCYDSLSVTPISPIAHWVDFLITGIIPKWMKWQNQSLK